VTDRRILAAAFFLVAAGVRGEKAPPLTVAAAANVRPALEEIRRVYERNTGTALTISYGASGILTRQIEQGAPFDLFLSADSEFIRKLEEEKLLAPGSRREYAIGSLVVAVRRDRVPPKVLPDLVGPGYAKIAIANPDTAPYGRAALQALERARLIHELRPRLVFAENVRDALRYAETGDADAAFAAASETAETGLALMAVPQELYEPIRQEAAVVGASAKREAAQTFLRFLTSPETGAIWKRHGYTLP
jgi:molybdate transport system substrate-binding protein